MKRFYKRTIRFLCVTMALFFLFGTASPVRAAGAQAKVLIEASTGEILSAEGENDLRCVAGLSRLMSQLLFFEHMAQGKIRAEDSVNVSAAAAAKRGTRVFLDSGSAYSFELLLKASVMCSANDATTALAEHIAGTEESFVALMNQRAKELNLTAIFSDCTGIDEAGNKLSAKDVALIAAELSRYAKFFEYSSIWMDTFVHNSGRETQMVNANQLVKTGAIDGMTTASSSEAGYCTVASQKSGSARYLAVVIGAQNSETRFAAARELLAYGTGNYSVKSITTKGTKIRNAKVAGAGNLEVGIYSAGNMALLLKKGEETAIEPKVEIGELMAPIAAGEKVGSLSVALPDGSIKSVDLIVTESIEIVSLLGSLRRIASDWLHLTEA